MERFAIVVDSSADLTQEQYDAMHIDGFIPLSFSIDGKEYLSYPDERELTAEELYATLRNTKAVVGTSQPNPGRIEDALEALLRQGKDVLYIAFTSGLSGAPVPRPSWWRRICGNAIPDRSCLWWTPSVPAAVWQL